MGLELLNLHTGHNFEPTLFGDPELELAAFIVFFTQGGMHAAAAAFGPDCLELHYTPNQKLAIRTKLELLPGNIHNSMAQFMH